MNSKKILIFVGILIIVVGFFLFINKSEDYVLKSEYKVGELGYLDDIEITLKDVYYINNHSGIELTFVMKNKRDNTITIIADEYFKFYDINKVQIPNKYTNDKNIIKKDETITYKLQYDMYEKELFEIYFYSQIVENNIKFSFISSDILPENK